MTTRTPVHEGSPPTSERTLTDEDVKAVGKAFRRAAKAVAKETRKRNRAVAETIIPAPAPRSPDDNSGDSGDHYTDRADQLLGSFAKVAPVSYSLSDLASDAQAMDTVFSGRAYTG